MSDIDTGCLQMKRFDDISQLLIRIYGCETGQEAFQRIRPLLIRQMMPSSRSGESARDAFNEKDIVLITYADTLIRTGESPLKTIHDFVSKLLKSTVSTLHILPFFPYSSDDGFSVIDYYQVKPEHGSWDDISRIACDFKLMVDLVLNHISAQSQWFENFLLQKPGYEHLAIEVDPLTDLTAVTRPRSGPLLTPKIKGDGQQVWVWTTFSSDQIDLNYQDINVLEHMIKVCLFYINHGASILRLDAIAYLWKEIGTRCIHHAKTHELVQLLRIILDMVAPDVLILTETNVPHDENISYFGNGENEAQIVYNFTLPPLLLYTLHKEDSTILTSWAKTLRVPSPHTTFFNFTASHDGIGVRPLEGIVERNEIEEICELVRHNGGYVSYKKNPDGSESPYELNITYLDALRKRDTTGDPYHIHRFMASQAIAMIMPGIPGVYIHSLLGTPNWIEGVMQTHMPRTINRKALLSDEVVLNIKDPETVCSRIFYRYTALMTIRKNQPAFHPSAPFEVLDINPRTFVMLRSCPSQTILSVVNISSEAVRISLQDYRMPAQVKDLISGESVDTGSMRLKPYQYRWLNISKSG